MVDGTARSSRKSAALGGEGKEETFQRNHSGESGAVELRKSLQRER